MKSYTIYYRIRDGNNIVSEGDFYVVKARDAFEALKLFHELIQGKTFVTEIKEGKINY